MFHSDKDDNIPTPKTPKTSKTPRKKSNKKMSATSKNKNPFTLSKTLSNEKQQASKNDEI